MKRFFTIALIILCLACSATPSLDAEPKDCDEQYIQNLFQSFDYWMKHYDHKDLNQSQSFAVFPSFDDALAKYGADYSDYLCLMKYANAHGYSIILLTKQNGYYRQIEQVFK